MRPLFKPGTLERTTFSVKGALLSTGKKMIRKIS